jgi:hypothetical protein
MIFAVLVQCTQVNKMLVMMLLRVLIISTPGRLEMPGHGGNRTYDLSKGRRFDSHRDRHIFQACPVWI